MGLLGADDLNQMQNDLAEVRSDHEISIVIRRKDETLTAQTVRIARVGGSGLERDSLSAQEVRGRVIVTGPTTLDIEAGDRFNDDNGLLYQVLYVRPNRTVDTVAEADVIQ